MTQPVKAQEAREPSMEEILASIRRIIADDKPAAEPAPPMRPAAAAALPQPVAEPAAAPPNNQADIDAMLAGFDAEPAAAADIDDVLELTEEMAVQERAAAIDAGWPGAPDDDLEFAESPVAEEPVSGAGVPDRDHAGRDTEAFDPLRAEPEDFEPRGFGRRDAGAVEPVEPPVAAAPQPMLSHATVSAVESAFNSLATTVLSNNARTLEDLVKEMLRPMLKSWLDDNLPTLVERIVRAEIERVSRGR